MFHILGEVGQTEEVTIQDPSTSYKNECADYVNVHILPYKRSTAFYKEH
jgi:hypothetical protein